MQGSHLGDILAIMRRGEFSDLTFICKEQSFYVHKAIVCAQSTVLKDDIRSAPMTHDSHIIKIDMSKFEAETVELFVKFLYTGDCNSVRDSKPSKLSDSGPDMLKEILSHVHAYNISSHYKVEKMAIRSVLNLRALLKEFQDTNGLISALPHAAREVTSLAIAHSTGPSIRGVLSVSFAHHLDSLRDTVFDIAAMPEFYAVVLKVCARNMESDRKATVENKKRTQELEERDGKKWATIDEVIQLVRDRKTCINETCKSRFDATITENFELTCRSCDQKQKLIPTAPGTATATATKAANPTPAPAPAPVPAPKPAPSFVANSAPAPVPSLVANPAPKPTPKPVAGPARIGVFGTTPTASPVGVFGTAPTPTPVGIFGTTPTPTPVGIFGTTPKASPVSSTAAGVNPFAVKFPDSSQGRGKHRGQQSSQARGGFYG